MTTESQRLKGREGALSSLNAAVDALNLARDVSSITPAKAALDSASILLITIRVGFSTSYPCHRLMATMYAGLNGPRGGLRRTRASLRSCL